MFLFHKDTKKRISLCIAIPYRKRQFMEWSGYHTDFYKILCSKYKTDDEERLWKGYRATAKKIRKCVCRLRLRGVTIIDQFSLEDIKKVADYDVVIIMAHKRSCPESIELWEGAVSSNKMVEAFPEDFTGAVDMAVCNSDDFLDRFRLHCPLHSPSPAPSEKKAIASHTAFLPLIIDDYLRNGKKEYIESFNEIYQKVAERAQWLEKEARRKEEEKKTIYLGSDSSENDESSLYAPRSVMAGDEILVQLYIHKQEFRNEVEICAKKEDLNAEKIKMRSLRMKLCDEDTIKARLVLNNNENNEFEILGSDILEGELNGQNKTDFLFYVRVNKDCHKRRFIGTIQIFVNEESVPSGDMTFHVNILNEGDKTDDSPAEIDNARSRKDMRIDTLNELKELLKERLEKKSTKAKEKRLINRCLQLLNARDVDPKGRKNVFVSSTSDMKDLRDVTKKEIESLEKKMKRKLPLVMYEDWTAESIRPCNKCCKEVMGSGYFILLIGSRYGYIENEFDFSMTQIEYLTARFSDKPILAFIEGNMTDVDKKQQDFINRVRKDLLVSEFRNKEDLKEQVGVSLEREVKRNKKNRRKIKWTTI